MRKVPFLLFALCAVLVWISTSSMMKSRDITEKRELGKFTKINVSSIFDVEYTYSPEASCVVSGDAKLVALTKTRIEGEVLYIEFAPNHLKNSNGDLKIQLSGPEFHGADISGVAEFKLNGKFPKAPIDLFVSGASEFEGAIDATTLTANLSGTADVKIKGQSTKGEIVVCGTVDLKAGEFTTDELKITMSGTASAKIRVTKKLDAHTSGVSSLTYFGNPGNINKVTEGLSTIVSL